MWDYWQERDLVWQCSPTISVGYEAVDELPKEAHESPMLSLGKTKDREELRSWLKDKEGLLSWKLEASIILPAISIMANLSSAPLITII